MNNSKRTKKVSSGIRVSFFFCLPCKYLKQPLKGFPSENLATEACFSTSSFFRFRKNV